ncbi:hypothetical protein IBT50_25395 [Bacillus sp. S70]|uniref:YopX family protein n=1 Tax=unclassified Bacillus (in: firmicutes) TaxID=185979 RepID=UPI00190D3BD5|nr:MULTISPECIES: YopX family protein [unclassified Bacillus (in: firmicutes)]MBJ9983556.1 hypothetical protein [Bacillus sp. S29]MBK0104698.1 hypothetical protein [Bacillus sp. S70]MBK0110044.1 hypothetical protein [Bacillus sp. S73]MBK0138825.1 hypothetical protein [Bacillus sp. S72]MBK0148015.1 hypothetical protein [Bacillus sp. S74]
MNGFEFRTWDKKAKVMEQYHYLQLSPNGQLYHDGMNVTDNYEIMQYTGLNDAYEKKIFEGDIVYQEFYDRISEKHGFTGVVKQMEGAWWICNGVDHAELLWSEVNLNHVKGNIYENLELLENWTK